MPPIADSPELPASSAPNLTETQVLAPAPEAAPAPPIAPAPQFVPAAGTAAAYPAQPVPGAATAGTLAPAVRFALRPAGLGTIGIVAGATLVIGLLAGLCFLLSVLAMAGGNGDLGAGTAIGALFAFAGGSLGAGFGLTAVDGYQGVLNSGVNAYVLSLGTLTAVAAAVFLITRSRLRREPAVQDRMVRGVSIVLDALGTAVPITLITGLVFAKIQLPFAGEIVLRSHWGLTLLITALVVGAASAAGRAAAHSAAPRPASAVTALLGGLREAVGYHLVLLSVFVPIVVIALIVLSAKSGNASGLLVGLPLLGNLAAFAIGFGHLGGATGSVAGFGGGTGQTMMAWDLFSGHGGWLIAVAVLTTLFAALWIGVRRQRLAAPSWARVWQFPMIVMLVWVALSLGLAGMRTTASGALDQFSASFAGSVQLSWWTGLVMLAWAALVSVLAEFAPGFLYGFAPGGLSALGGRRSAQLWLSGAPRPGTLPAAVPGVTVAAQPWAAPPAPPAPDAPAPPMPPAPAGDAASLPPAPPVPPVPADAAPPAPSLAAESAPLASVPAPPQPPVSEALPPAPVPDSGAAVAPAPLPPAGQNPFQPQDAQPTVALPAAGLPTGQPWASPAPASAIPVAEPMSPKAKKRLAMIGGGVLLLGLLAGGGAVALNVINGSRGPAGTVERYLEMLASGNAEGATAMVDPGIKNTERVLLNNDVLGSAEHRIQVLSVREEQKHGNSASVSAEYAIDGEKYQHSFMLQAGPKESGLLDTWELSEGLIMPVTISGNGVEEVLIGKTVVPLTGSQQDSDDDYSSTNSVTLFAYPGLYTLTPPTSDMLVAEPQQVLVSSESSSYVELVAAPSEDFATAVLTQIEERATRCVTVPSNMDSECPGALQDKNLSSMQLVSAPSDFDDLTMTSFSSTDAVFRIVHAKSSWSSASTEDVEYSFSGSITMTDGKPVVEFDTGWGW